LIGSPEIRNRLIPGIALTSLLRARGADVFRVHDVKENLYALQVTEAILQRAK
jgi:dihydropteroate synthase